MDTANSINYATAAHYSPAGALASLANAASVVSTLFYNKRLQPCRNSVKYSGSVPASCADGANIGNVLDFTYNFSLGSGDNGNVMGITNNRDTTRSQSFSYDQLNRLASAQTSSTSGSTCWDEAFGYDSWGNLLSIGRLTGYSCANEELLSVTVNAYNRITNTGYTYDTPGNELGDGVRSFTYDAENHLTAAAGVNYLYDGDGKRVEKSNGKLYWYGIGSDPLDESDGSGNISMEYIFFGGRRVARRDSSGNVVYYFSDHLGTSRIVTNSTGSTILDDSDFYPFGGERPVLSSSGNTYKFTAKERDSESGLDNFSARFDSSSIGRFLSPDPLLGSAVVENPQSWNRYAYVSNNPLRLTDPTGLFDWDPSAGGNLSDEDLEEMADGDNKDNKKWAKQALEFRQNFRAGLDAAYSAQDSPNLSASQADALGRAVNAYGTEGDNNGVKVGKEQGHGGGTILKNDDTILVTIGNALKGDVIAATIAHEGEHVAQASAWLDGGESSIGDLTHSQREAQAWNVSSIVGQALGMKDLHPYGGGADMDVWNRGWKVADLNTRRAHGIGNILDFMTRKSPEQMGDTYSAEHHHQDP